jgi:hypothetical protein
VRGAGKWVMSAPVSAMMTSATPWLIPGMVTNRSRTATQEITGGHCSGDVRKAVQVVGRRGARPSRRLVSSVSPAYDHRWS